MKLRLTRRDGIPHPFGGAATKVDREPSKLRGSGFCVRRGAKSIPFSYDLTSIGLITMSYGKDTVFCIPLPSPLLMKECTFELF